jgi:hypothetical protein
LKWLYDLTLDLHSNPGLEGDDLALLLNNEQILGLAEVMN